MKSFAALSSYLRLAAFGAVLSVASLFAYAPCQAQAEDNAVLGGRTLSIVSTSGQAGSQVNVSVELDSQGDEVAASFSLGWDPAIFSNPLVTLGSGAPAGASLGVNTNQAAQGRLGVLVDATVPFGLSAPDRRQVINVRFDVAANAASGTSAVNFITMPTPPSVSNVQGSLLTTVYQVGAVTVTSANTSLVTISGRVTSPAGQNLRNIQVSLIDAQGVRRVATTSSFGIYTFTDVVAPRGYTVTVASKRYRFAARVIDVTDSIANLDFVGLE